MEAIQKIERSIITQKEIEDYLFTSETKLNDKQKAMFVKLAQLHNLNPFKREIYAIPYGKEFSIVTGYQTYIQRAEATGDLDGWNVESNNETAKITIWRKSFSHPFIWEVDKSDFGKNYGSWKSMPKFMLKKVAIGQGFRLAFPNELGSMPYLREEVEGAEPFKKAPEMTSKQQKPKIDIKIPKQRNYTEEANECKSLQELKAWWTSLNAEEKKLAAGVKKNRKIELTKEAENPDTYNPKDLITAMLKTAKTTNDLDEIGKEIDTIKNSKKRLSYINQFKKKIAELGINYEMNILPF